MILTITAIDRHGEIAPPRTKKNSATMLPNRARPVLIPSNAYLKWERAAIRSLLGEGIIKAHIDLSGEKTYRVVGAKAIDYAVNCRALIYREMRSGDAVGFYQAIGDFLQLAGVVVNDKFIVSWDGTRLLKDPVRPRVELELTRVGESVQGELFEALELA